MIGAPINAVTVFKGKKLSDALTAKSAAIPKNAPPKKQSGISKA